MDFYLKQKFSSFFNLNNEDKDFEEKNEIKKKNDLHENNDFFNNFGDLMDEEIEVNNNENNNNNEETSYFNNTEINFQKFIIEDHLQKNKGNKFLFSNFDKIILFLYLKINLNLIQSNIIFSIFLKYFNSKYTSFENLLNDFYNENQIQNCYYCNKCKIIKKYSTFKINLKCTCGDSMQEFLYNSYIDYLRKIIKDENICDLQYYKKLNQNKTDYFNSYYYLKYFKKFEKKEIITIYNCYNVDGLVTKKNSKRSLYPFFIQILNVDPIKRKSIQYNHLLCLFNKKKKLMYHLMRLIIYLYKK